MTGACGSLPWLSIDALQAGYRNRDFTCVEVVEATLERIVAINPILNAFIEVHATTACREAAESDARRDESKNLGPLDGILVAIKDNIAIKGSPCSAGVGARQNLVARANAKVIDRLKSAGAVILGRLNMHEGAFGSSTDNPWFGTCRNPHALEFIPGGSSGGSGAAVAAGLCTVALGTDTLGSIREPAHACGVVGHKPSFGLVSARGVTPMGARLDVVGPLARSVCDARATLAVLAGYDPDYAWSTSYPDLELRPGDRMSIGLFDLSDVAFEPGVEERFEAAIKHFSQLGVKITRLGRPPLDLLALARAAAIGCVADTALEFEAELNAGGEGLSDEFKASLGRGKVATAIDLARAWSQVEGAVGSIRKLFANVDAIAMPTTPRGGIRIADALEIGLSTTRLVGWVNAMGCAAVSLPMGFGPDGLPLGMQLVGLPGSDFALLNLAEAFEVEAKLDMRPNEHRLMHTC